MAAKQSWSLFYVEERRSIFLAVPCNTLVILKMKTIGFLFKHIFYSFNIRCNCFMFMSNIFCFIILRLSAFDFIAYFFYSTKCNILEQPCLVWQNISTCFTETYEVRSDTWNLQVIDMISYVKSMDFFTLYKKERFESILITHCDVAWYIVEKK